MTTFNITEATTVQFPMIRHAAEIGWKPLSPQDALHKRGGEAELLFRDELEGALRRFNPWMTDDAIRAVVERLEAIAPTIEGNREMLAWLRGERQWYDEAESRSRPVQLVDFAAPSNNTFHVTWEWKLKPPARKGNRADVMFVVNGIPVAIVEHKNPKDADAIERGVTQLRRYEQETPELLGTAQLFNVAHLLNYWYGVTWNIVRRSMARWKEQREESYRFAVQSFFAAYKEIEALWEILSPSLALRDHIDTFRRLARLYETVRNAYTRGTNYTADLANKTRLLVQENATQ